MDYCFDHIAIATRNIVYTEEYFTKVLGYKIDNEIIDHNQNLKAHFIELNGNYIELLEKYDINKISPIDNNVKRCESSIHHICYSVSDIDAAYKKLKEFGFVKVKKKAIQYDKFMINFFISPDNTLIELKQYKNINIRKI